jgi:hypothetical protein
MFPDPQLQRFGAEDRVPVVIFYLDEYIDPENPTWRMLFEGEIVGWSYTNSAGGRALQFDCVMDIAMYTQLFLFYMSSVSALGQGHAASQTNPTVLNQAVTEYPYALFHRGLIDNKDASFITRPFDLAYNVVRGLISSNVPDERRCIPMVNFFTRWCRRNQFHNKWVALPFLDEQHDENLKVKTDQPQGVFPIFRAVKSQLAVDAIQKHVMAEYSGATVWTMLKRVFDTVFMEMVMLPTPAAVSTFTNGSIIGKPIVRTQEELNKLHKAALAKQQEETKASAAAFGTPLQSFSLPVPSIIDPKKPLRLTNYFIKPQFFFGLPPTCNVIFPSMTPQFQYRESYVTQPTRLYFEDNALAALVGGQQGRKDISDIITNALSRAYPPEADVKHRRRIKGTSGGETGKNLLIWPEEFFKGPVTARVPAPPWLMYFAAAGQGKGAKTTSAADSKTVDPANGTSLTDNDVYLLYAQYEYFRQRYIKRGGAVSCAFQPYVIPGFPLMVFDDFQSRMHLIGYLMNARQTISSSGTGTQLNFSYARTIYEFLADIKNEIDNPAIADRKGLATAAAPPEPIPEIRDIIQHEFKADQFYQALLHQRSDKDISGKKNKTAVFRARDLVAFVNSDGTLEDISIEGKNEESIKNNKVTAAWAKKFLTALKASPNAGIKYARGTANAEDSGNFIKAVNFAVTGDTADGGDLTLFGGGYTEVAQNAVLKDPAFDKLLFSLDSIIAGLNSPTTIHNLANVATKELTPKPGVEPYFDSYDAAMKYCARPVCTLEDYIKFIGGQGVSPQDDAAYKDGSTIPSARYYTQIRQLKGVKPTDDPPTKEQRGIGTSNGGGDAVDLNFPVMRAEWTLTLLRYRRNVYNTVKVQR